MSASSRARPVGEPLLDVLAQALELVFAEVPRDLHRLADPHLNAREWQGDLHAIPARSPEPRTRAHVDGKDRGAAALREQHEAGLDHTGRSLGPVDDVRGDPPGRHLAHQCEQGAHTAAAARPARRVPAEALHDLRDAVSVTAGADGDQRPVATEGQHPQQQAAVPRSQDRRLAGCVEGLQRLVPLDAVAQREPDQAISGRAERRDPAVENAAAESHRAEDIVHRGGRPADAGASAGTSLRDRSKSFGLGGSAAPSSGGVYAGRPARVTRCRVIACASAQRSGGCR